MLQGSVFSAKLVSSFYMLLVQYVVVFLDWGRLYGALGFCLLKGLYLGILAVGMAILFFHLD